MGWREPPTQVQDGRPRTQTCWEAADAMLANFAEWRRMGVAGTDSTADPYELTGKIDRLLEYRFAHTPADVIDERELVHIFGMLG